MGELQGFVCLLQILLCFCKFSFSCTATLHCSANIGIFTHQCRFAQWFVKRPMSSFPFLSVSTYGPDLIRVYTRWSICGRPSGAPSRHAQGYPILLCPFSRQNAAIAPCGQRATFCFDMLIICACAVGFTLVKQAS